MLRALPLLLICTLLPVPSPALLSSQRRLSPMLTTPSNHSCARKYGFVSRVG